MIEPYLRQSALDHLALAGRARSGGDAVRLWERPLPAAINLRGPAADPAFVEAVRSALGVEPPTTPNTAAAAGGLALLWLGPDEWLAVRHDAAPGDEAALAEKLRRALGALHAAVTEVGESLCCIAVAGPRARDLIAKGCPLDLHPRVFGPTDNGPTDNGPTDNGRGHCAQSHLAKTAITLHQRSTGDDGAPEFDLYTRRSFSDYLWRWLEDAAREYGA